MLSRSSEFFNIDWPCSEALPDLPRRNKRRGRRPYLRRAWKPDATEELGVPPYAECEPLHGMAE
jgi:hypothetical protein